MNKFNTTVIVLLVCILFVSFTGCSNNATAITQWSDYPQEIQYIDTTTEDLEDKNDFMVYNTTVQSMEPNMYVLDTPPSLEEDQ